MKLVAKALQGVKWNTAVTIADTVAQILKIAVLTRFMEKADFGLLAIINMVLGFTGMFTDLGLTVAIFHKQNITRLQYSTIYWLNWALNISIFLIICAVAPFIARFYKDPRLTHLIVLMAITIVIAPIGKIFATIKTKNLEFDFISKVRIATSLLGFLLVIFLAFLNFGIYSLIISSIASGLLSSIILSVAGRKEFSIMWGFNYAEIKDFLKIGIYDTGKQILDYISYKIDVLLIGKFFGMESLGIYNLGKELVLKPMKILNPIFTSVATPIFAKIQNDLTALKTNYLLLLNILSFIIFPILAIFFVMAGPLVEILYGANYSEVAFYVQILSLWGIFATIGNPAGALMVAKGRTDLGFSWTLIRVSAAPVAIYIASFFSIQAVAISQVILQVIFYGIYWRILIFPLSGINLKEYFFSVKNALLFSGVAGGVILLLKGFLPGNAIYHLLLGSSIFTVIYLAITYINDKKLMNLMYSLVFTKPKI